MKTGLDALKSNYFAGQKLGLVTNQTGIDSTFRRTAEVIKAVGGEVVALFGAEHGYYGVVQDALPVEGVPCDKWSGLPVYSLYREHDYDSGNATAAFGPPEGSLAGLDGLVFDIQDIGCRYYTYPTTLGILLEQVDLPVYVVDRPNPIGGDIVEGAGIEPQYSSFVGRYPQIPVRHGLTIGELALYLNRFLLNGRAKVEILKMEGWQRSMSWEETKLTWVAPSPNMPTLTTARLYPGTCLIEGTNLSIGRGTTQPFELVGAPWLTEPDKLAKTLNQLNFAGVYFRDTFFKPCFDRFSEEVCGGVQVHIGADGHKNGPTNIVRSGISLVATLARLYPQDFRWHAAHFDRLIGSAKPRQIIEQANGDINYLTPLFAEWAEAEKQFREKRKEVLTT
jgi:uncharacterized protein YbbC (DUF1343 family)